MTQSTLAQSIQSDFLQYKTFLSAFVYKQQRFCDILAIICDRFRLSPQLFYVTLERDFHLFSQKAAPKTINLEHIFSEYFKTKDLIVALEIIGQTYDYLQKTYPENGPHDLLKKYFLRRPVFLLPHSLEQTDLLYQKFYTRDPLS